VISAKLKRALALVVLALPIAVTIGLTGGSQPASAATAGNGYWLVARDGGVFTFGDGTFHGSTGSIDLNEPIVGMAAHPSGNGYWFVAADGGVFAFGSAKFFGSMGGKDLNEPIVGMAAHPSGNGYWLVARDGGIFSFGDSKFHGSTGSIDLNEPIVGMTAHPSGNGYWFVAADGGIFAFGDSKFFGSMGGKDLNEPIVGMAAHPGSGGYWLVASDGGIFSFGSAKFHGSTGSIDLNEPIVGMTAHPSGNGYWFVASDGGVFAFGDSKFFGSMGGKDLNEPIVGMAVTPEATRPSVTVNQASGQEDPTDEPAVDFTVVFSEPVTGFTGSDVTIGGTAGGTKTATVTGSGTTYNVAVSGMTSDGTITVSVPEGKAVDAAGNGNTASTSTDNTVTYENTDPSVTVNQASDQEDPTDESAIDYTVVFSKPVTGFTAGDVDVAGTAGGTKTVTVTGSGTTYNVAISGMTSDGTVIPTIDAGKAFDAIGNPNTDSTSTDNTVTYDNTDPGTTVSTADNQENPTDETTIDFKVVFTEDVTGFETGDVTPGGTAPGTKTAVISGSGTTYNVAVSGVTGDGTVTVQVPAGAAIDAAGNPNAQSNEHVINVDRSAPTMTVTKAATQENPTDEATIDFTVTFNEEVIGFGAEAGDVTAAGSAPGPRNVVITNSGDDKTFNVAVSGMTDDGTVTLAVPAGAATNRAGIDNAASPTPVASVDYDNSAPTPTVAKAATQENPTDESIIDFTVTFDEPVTGFDSGADDVDVTGTPGGTATIGDAGDTDAATYTVTVTGMTGSGTVSVTIPAGAATDLAGNDNLPSNTASVDYDNQAPTFDSITATGESDAVTAKFSQPVLCSSVQSTDFTASINGSPVGVTAADCTGTTDDEIVLTLASEPTGGAAVSIRYSGNGITDQAGNEAPRPTTRTTTATTTLGVTVAKAATPVQEDPTDESSIDFTVQFTAPVANFTNEDVVVGGTATFATKTVTVGTSTDGGKTYNVAVSGMNGNQLGTVTVTVPAGKASDSAGNLNSASNTATVTYDTVRPTVTVAVPSSQEDPTDEPSVEFTITTSEATDLQQSDLQVGGTAAPTTVTLTQTSPTTYTASVTGMTQDGTVTLTVPATSVADPAGNTNAAASSASVVRDTQGPTATIDKSATQNDPTNDASIEFTVTFSDEAFDVTSSDFEATNGAGTSLAVSITKNSATVYTAAVTGMSADGPVTLTLLAQSVADKAGNKNASAASGSVTYETVRPTVTVTSAGEDPTDVSPIVFDIEFSEPMFGFTTDDVVVTAAGNETMAFTVVDGNTYRVQISGMGEGPVTVSVPENVAQDSAGNGNAASTGDNTVVYDTTGPTATVGPKAGQANPTNTGPILFTVSFNEAAYGFANGDLVSTPTGTSATITDPGDGKTSYTVSVAGLAPNTASTVTLTVSAGSVQDKAGNSNSAAATGSVVYDNVAPVFNSIAADAGSTQVVATFSEAILCSTVAADGGDFLVTVNNEAGGVTAATCTGTSDATIELTIEPAPAANQTVKVQLQPNAVTDPAGNAALTQERATTATPLTVTVAPAATQENPTNENSIEFTITFSEPVTGLTAAEVSVTAPGTESKALTPATGPAAVYTLTVTNADDGDIVVSVPANVAQDADGTNNEASAPATVTRDTVAPAMSGVTATGGNAVVVVAFNDTLTCATVAKADFGVAFHTAITPATGAAAEIASATCAGDQVTLTLTAPAPPGTTVKVTLVATGGGNGVEDDAGNSSGTGGTAEDVAEADPV
jgi:ribosomal protein L24E/UDP-3-O-acyl-N-acetylglucosamine deacetylase